MLLTSISVSNFRCFEELSELPLAPLTAFIGPNDSGKSSLLALLRHCLRDEPLPGADFRDSNLPVVMDMAFKVKRASEAENAQEFMCSEQDLRLRKTFRPGARPSAEVYRLCYEDDRLNRIDALSMAELNALLVDLGAARGGLTNNDLRRAAVRQAIQATPPPQHEAWVEADARLTQVLPEYILFGADEDLTLQAGPLVATLRQVYRRFLEEQPQEIQVLLDQARARLQDEVGRLNPIVESFAPDGSALVIDPQLDISNSLSIGEIRVRKANGEVLSFNRCGDGTKRRIMLGIFNWANDVLGKIAEDQGRSVLWGFDEPDTHLHYEAQYALLAKLRGMTVGPMQILVCTHSIPIIDRLPAHVVRLMVPDRSTGRTSVLHVEGGEDVTEFLRSVGRGVGFPNSLLFYERCFILVEGPTEEKALPILYRKLHGSELIDDGIRLFAAESDHAVLRLAHLLHTQGKEVVLLLDSDAQGKHAAIVEKLQNDGCDVASRIIYAGTAEFEDTFPDQALVECLNAHFPRVDGQQWADAHLAPHRQPTTGGAAPKFSHEFLEVEVARQARTRVAKPEFGRKLAEGIDPAMIPVEVRNVFDIARRIANT